jgi:class 3 adenylate cyclase
MADEARELLERLLAERNERPENLAGIDRRIWDAFGATRAVWVLDMCGFSRLTMRHGITHFLGMIHRLHGYARPVIAGNGGTVVKTEADNVFAMFPDVGPALTAARDLHRTLVAANTYLPQDWDLHASIGIGWGQVLLIGGDDFYGNELNIASKLGEDVAGPGETFLTAAAHARLGDTRANDGDGAAFERREIPISAMSVVAFRLL